MHHFVVFLQHQLKKICNHIGTDNSASPLARRHAIRRSPHTTKKQIAKEFSQPIIDVVDSVEPTDPNDPTDPMPRQRGGSAVIDSRRDSSLSKESKTKSLEDILQSSSDSVSDLEKTVDFGPKEVTAVSQFVNKEKLELESSKKVSPVVIRKAMDLPRGRERHGTLFGDDDSSPILRHKHNVMSGTAAAAAAAAAASKSEVSISM